MTRNLFLVVLAAMLGLSGAAPLAAQSMRTIDPNQAIDGDLSPAAGGPARPRALGAPPPAPAYPDEPVDPGQPDPGRVDRGPGPAPAPPPPADPTRQQRADATVRAADTFERDDLIGAGEDVFGRGVAGFGEIIERILREQGRPNAYIAGREASGAFVLGLRYGSGIMTHKVEGQRPVYWTGPSVGFDVGGDANKVFVLVYNLYDTQELFRRFPAAEGRLYLVGGFAATYLRRGNVVLIPVRLGVGWRAGVNIGYMNFTPTSRWLPF